MSFTGTPGNDTWTGDGGNNTITGANGNDSLSGAGGNDTISGNNGNDTIFGDDGADSLLGNNDNDSMDGGEGNDTINGGGGNDTLIAGNGVDQLLGGAGNDSLVAGGGNDLLYGETGDDTLVANGGDILYGGDGNDLFVISGTGNFASGQGNVDTVTFTASGNYTFTSAPGVGGWTVTGPGGTTNTITGIENVNTPAGTSAITAGTIYVCFAAGTRILTAEGEVEVERLKAGDLVATLSGRGSPMKPVLWLGRRRVVLAGHPNADAIAPVRIMAGALGQGAPHRDLLVSPDHCLFLDGALVPARLLVNGTTIVAERGLAEVTYYHVELESHDVLLAEGAAAESWLDCDNRSWFENAPVARFAVSGPLAEAGSGWDATRACAPLLHGGEKLAAIREAIAARIGTDRKRHAA
jgi:hypothetical protein